MKRCQDIRAVGRGLGLALLLIVAVPVMPAPHGLRLVEPRQAAPELGLEDIDGRRHRLSDYRGQVLVVNFWATWCTPCREELPAMTRAAAELEPLGVRFITVAMGQTAAEVRQFLEFQQFPLAKLVDPDARVAENWRVQGLPTSYVVDPQGRLTLRIVGSYDWDASEIKQRIVDLATE
jgi:thiol-disulfide isomerase/thioredoxin